VFANWGGASDGRQAGAEMTITAKAADGVGVRAFDQGAGPVILVIHPGLDDGRSWGKAPAEVAQVIAALARRVLPLNR
jgi:hypothetical protein